MAPRKFKSGFLSSPVINSHFLGGALPLYNPWWWTRVCHRCFVVLPAKVDGTMTHSQTLSPLSVQTSRTWRLKAKHLTCFPFFFRAERWRSHDGLEKGEARLEPADEDVNWYYWSIVDELIISLITSQCAGQIIDKQLFEAKMSTTLYLSRRSRSEWLKNKWLSS